MLDEIVAKQRQLLPEIMTAAPLNSFENKIEKKDFSLSKKIKQTQWSLIAECKLASPVKGQLCQNKTVKELAKIYEANGATALSVHTNEYFKGKLIDLREIKQNVSLPVMRKEFIIEPYQVYETAYMGADALLLIARIVSSKQLEILYKEATLLGLDCLVEVHDERDIEKALTAGCELIGINNRDLTTFKTDVKNTLRLKPLCEDKIVISESGIREREDIELLQACGVGGILVGEALVSARDIERKTRQMALVEEEKQ